MSGPYASAAALYWDAGWRGVLPLPANRKASPPTGWTGRAGAWPSRADVEAWVGGSEGHGNVGLRLPVDVIGLDVDNYSGKQGAATIKHAESQWGELLPTWRSTSRDDGVSGIYLFRAPTGLAWPGELGPGVEVIQHAHRYAVAWPSVHPEGRTYRWLTPVGVMAVSAVVPVIAELPELPHTWVTGMTQGRAFDDGLLKADLSHVEVSAWLGAHGGGQPCAEMSRCLDDYLPRFGGGSSRHDAARDAVRRITALAAEGHLGMTVALARIERAFGSAVEADRDRAVDPGEWRRCVDGAVALAAVAPVTERDPCAVTVLDAAADRLGAVAVSLADVAPERVDWLWPGRLPLGKLVVFDGDPSVGKSTCAVDWAARVSSGAAWPDGAPNRAGTVLLLSAEDGLADTIRPRLDAASGDPSKVHALTSIRYLDNGVTRERSITLADVDDIGRAVREAAATLVVVDVLMAYLPGKVDSHRDQDVRGVLSAVAAMAEATHCCVVMLRHLNKSGGGQAMYRGGGSIAIIGAARMGLLAAVDPDDEDRRVLAATKSNLAAMPDALGYRLVDSPEHGCARVDWLGMSTHTAGALLSGPRDEDERTERDDAALWLADFLSTQNGREAAKATVVKLGKIAGHTERTLQRAMKQAHVESARVGFPAMAVWRLVTPPVTPLAPLDPSPSERGATGQAGAATEIRGLQRDEDDRSRQLRHRHGDGTTELTDLDQQDTT
jgi:hypothetical protein